MFSKYRNSNKAFTLIELLVVVAIIGILSGVVLASLNSAREKGKIAAIKSNIKNMIAEAELAYDTAGNYSTACTAITKMRTAITSTGRTSACYTLDNTNWGVSVKLDSDTTKNYAVDPQGVVTWDTADASSGSTMDWATANSTCAGLGGKLPTMEQLNSLWIAHGANPPGFVSGSYWTSTTYTADTRNAWYIRMTDKVASYASKTGGAYRVRCVR